ncbi:MAG: rRNA maturation RNase YbeY [Alcanivoracaceae bacterium]|nr:rRNA maturation RNase YbeY [Alcanivoracaceae bacterium]
MIDVQIGCDDSLLGEVPNEAQLSDWAQQALNAACANDEQRNGDITVRIVDAEESQALNNEYRGKDKPTNVLSFPFEMPEGLPADAMSALLGDIAICVPVVTQEAHEQGKTLTAHWAHMIVHGVLHLLGYDHIDDADAEKMELLEITILANIGFADPYQLSA